MARGGQFIQHPVVQGAMIFKFQCAQRMSDAFKCIRNTMRVVVHRIDRPGITGLDVFDIANSIQGWITHIDIA